MASKILEYLASHKKEVIKDTQLTPKEFESACDNIASNYIWIFCPNYTDKSVIICNAHDLAYDALPNLTTPVMKANAKLTVGLGYVASKKITQEAVEKLAEEQGYKVKVMKLKEIEKEFGKKGEKEKSKDKKKSKKDESDDEKSQSKKKGKKGDKSDDEKSDKEDKPKDKKGKKGCQKGKEDDDEKSKGKGKKGKKDEDEKSEKKGKEKEQG